MKVVVFGATGVVGRAAAEYFGAVPNATCVAVVRRAVDLPGVGHVPLDLADADAAASAHAVDGIRADTTHAVFAALQESTELAAGWRDSDADRAQRSPCSATRSSRSSAAGASTLEHVSLLQGAKAYGFHVGRSPVPAKERSPRDAHDNFYFRQEDALRELAEGAPWSWTVFRPQVVFGESFGSPMNLVPVHRCLRLARARGRSAAVVPRRCRRRPRSRRRAAARSRAGVGRRRAGGAR